MVEMSRRPLTAVERQRLETLLAEVKEQSPLKTLACSSGCLLLILGLAGSSLLAHLVGARQSIHSFSDFFHAGGWTLCALLVAAVLLTFYSQRNSRHANDRRRQRIREDLATGEGREFQLEVCACHSVASSEEVLCLFMEDGLFALFPMPADAAAVDFSRRNIRVTLGVSGRGVLSAVASGECLPIAEEIELDDFAPDCENNTKFQILTAGNDMTDWIGLRPLPVIPPGMNRLLSEEEKAAVIQVIETHSIWPHLRSGLREWMGGIALVFLAIAAFLSLIAPIDHSVSTPGAYFQEVFVTFFGAGVLFQALAQPIAACFGLVRGIDLWRERRRLLRAVQLDKPAHGRPIRILAAAKQGRGKKTRWQLSCENDLLLILPEALRRISVCMGEWPATELELVRIEAGKDCLWLIRSAGEKIPAAPAAGKGFATSPDEIALYWPVTAASAASSSENFPEPVRIW